MDKIDTETTVGSANDNCDTNLDMINDTYLEKNNSLIKVKKEPQDLEEGSSSDNDSMVPNILRSEGEIKKEFQDSDGYHVYIKEEPTTTDEGDGSVASSFESTKVKQEDFGPCYKEIKGSLSGSTSKGSADDGCNSSPRGSQPTNTEMSGLREKQGTELIVWCGDEYGSELGLSLNAQQGQIGHQAAALAQPKKDAKKPQLPCTQLLKAHGEKSFCCTICQKVFTKMNGVKSHMRIHTGKRPFKCSVCLKEFTHYSHLNAHERVHTGERPYKCSMCPREFTHYSHVKTHERTHTGEKPFQCSVCQKRFSDKSPLVIHLRVHTGEKPFKCSVCSKRFSRDATLRRHIRVHTGEKPYNCSVCSKKFSDNSNLRAHERIHTGEKPYKCSVCSKGFSFTSNLKTHKRIHHQVVA